MFKTIRAAFVSSLEEQAKLYILSTFKDLGIYSKPVQYTDLIDIRILVIGEEIRIFIINDGNEIPTSMSAFPLIDLADSLYNSLHNK